LPVAVGRNIQEGFVKLAVGVSALDGFPFENLLPAYRIGARSQLCLRFWFSRDLQFSRFLQPRHTSQSFQNSQTPHRLLLYSLALLSCRANSQRLHLILFSIRAILQNYKISKIDSLG
jgi:hypothetical protein